MKHKRGIVIILAAVLLIIQSSCMLAKDWFETPDTSEVPSLTPSIFRPTDQIYTEPVLIFALKGGVELYTLEAEAVLSEFEEEEEDPEASDTLIEHELASALGEDESGLYYVVQSQRQAAGYALKEQFDLFGPDWYACAYTPKEGVNRAELVELGLFMKREGIMIEPVLAQSGNYITEEPVLTQPWLLTDIGLARKLSAAADALAERGYTLRITGGYYPQSARYELFRQVNNDKLVPDPKLESLSPTGRCADVTLLDSSGRELAFPSAVYAFVPEAKRPFQGAPREALTAMNLLDEVMTAAGLEPSGGFWWEYVDPETDFMPINISTEDMILTAKPR